MLSFDVTSDATDATRDARLVMLGRLSLSERFMHALALSVYVRQLAWQGALRHVGAHGETAVVDRFLTQLYGTDVAMSFRTARNRPHE